MIAHSWSLTLGLHPFRPLLSLNSSLWSSQIIFFSKFLVVAANSLVVLSDDEYVTMYVHTFVQTFRYILHTNSGVRVVPTFTAAALLLPSSTLPPAPDSLSLSFDVVALGPFHGDYNVDFRFFFGWAGKEHMSYMGLLNVRHTRFASLHR